MFDNDTKLLSEAYLEKILHEKAPTPEQIAKQVKTSKSTKGNGKLPTNKKEDKKVEKTLEKVPYTDQHADNFNQDNKDTTVKDPYVLKEDTTCSTKELVQFLQAWSDVFDSEVDDSITAEEIVEMALDVLIDAGYTITTPEGETVTSLTNIQPTQPAPSVKPAPEGVADAM